MSETNQTKRNTYAGVYPGNLFMVVAPSGAGKSTLVNALLAQDEAIRLSVSYTTRDPRPGEENGVQYHFASVDDFMARHAAKGACGGDATRLTGFEGRFSKPVWPGDTIVTQGWVTAPGKIALSVSVKERDETVITAASATFTL